MTLLQAATNLKTEATLICYNSSMSELKNIIGDHTVFLDDILARVEAEGFDMTDFSQLDHMCYRTVSNENYSTKKAQLDSVAQLLGETIVNGRPISTFRLKEPVKHGPWRIDAIELPAPKKNSSHEEGLEHVEFVLFDDMDDFFSKYEGKPFNLESADRGINPEIGLKLGKFSVKFHRLNLPTVIYLEKKLSITEVSNEK